MKSSVDAIRYLKELRVDLHNYVNTSNYKYIGVLIQLSAQNYFRPIVRI